jgi:hypothetical protein
MKKLTSVFLATLMFGSFAPSSFASDKPEVMPEDVVVITDESPEWEPYSEFQTFAAGWQYIGHHRLYADNLSGTWNYADWDLETKQQLGEVYTTADGGNLGLKFYPTGINTTSSGYPEGPHTLPDGSGGYQGYLEVMIYEDDGTSSAADHIRTFIVGENYLRKGGTVSTDISGFVDGSNNQAEIDVRYTWNFQAVPYIDVDVLD